MRVKEESSKPNLARRLLTTAITVLILLSILGLFVATHVRIRFDWRSSPSAPTYNFNSTSTRTIPTNAPALSFPPAIRKLTIDIGPNTSPLLPPDDDPSHGVLSVEANLGICNWLRQEYQVRNHSGRFFIVNTAVSGGELAYSLAAFNFYNSDGRSSSLSAAAANDTWADREVFDPSRKKYGPGEHGADFVTVLPLETLLQAIPSAVEIMLLKIDTQGHDFSVITSARVETVRRTLAVKAETYLPESAGKFYRGVSNDLFKDWIPYMKSIGFELYGAQPTRRKGEFDAVFNRTQ